MIEIATAVLTGTGIVAGAGLLAGHGWRAQRLGTRLTSLGQRLTDIEATMYAHEEPDEQGPRLAPVFALPAADGTIVSLDRLLARGKPLMLVFTDPAGQTGQSLLTSIETWQRGHDHPLTVAAIAPVGASRIDPADLPPGVPDILYLDAGDGIASAYGIALTPAVVLIRPNGAIAGPPTVGVRGIDRLLSSLATAAAEARTQREAAVERNTPGIGTRAPRTILSDGEDREQDVVAAGIAQILLFWSPHCGYCNQLAPDLHAWEASPPAALPPITLVARGTAAENRAEGFGFRTLLDGDLSASAAFGVLATPSAIVIDRHGVVASPLARGIREVRALLAMDAAVVPARTVPSIAR